MAVSLEARPAGPRLELYRRPGLGCGPLAAMARPHSGWPGPGHELEDTVPLCRDARRRPTVTRAVRLCQWWCHGPGGHGRDGPAAAAAAAAASVESVAASGWSRWTVKTRELELSIFAVERPLGPFPATTLDAAIASNRAGFAALLWATRIAIFALSYESW